MRKISYSVFLLLLMSSCATVISGSRQNMYFESDVPDVRVIIDGKEYGATPLKVKVKRGYNTKEVEFHKDGYGSKTLYLKPDFNYVSMLNLFNGSLGWAIDALTGAIMRYKKQYHKVSLKPEQQDEKSGPGSLF